LRLSMVHSPQFFCCRYARLVLNLSVLYLFSQIEGRVES
jgi:hypothetical protein